MKRKDILSYNKRALSITRYFMILVLGCISFVSRGQLQLDFDDQNFNIVKWQGNTSNFKINANGQLQLSAPAAGESSIYTKYKVPKDSIQADLYFKLQFAPSGDNFAKIYLFTDNIIESNANGFYLKLGENGSNDAIQVWKLNNGVSQLMASGNMGGISGDPADARVRFKIYRDGMWLMATDYSGNTIYEDDLEFADQGFSLQDSMYFGLYCKYTATRTDKFFFDDISIKTIEKDTSAPKVLSAEVIDDHQIKLTLSEVPEATSAQNVSNYTVDNLLGNPDNIIYASAKPQEVSLFYNTKSIQSGINYTLNIKNLKDKSNNQVAHQISFVYAAKPKKGELVITEILTDPYIGGDDFVEIYNRSTSFIKLDSLIIKNAQKSESKVINTSAILYPGKYLAISKNTGFLKTTYNTPDTAAFLEAILPSLNVDGANVSLISNQNGQAITIDSFDYTESMHFELLDFTKGVSLERISLSGSTNDANNWHSASSQVKYASPGYKNSNLSSGNPNTNEILKPDKKVFTPDGDSVDDFVLLQYNLPKPGYLATIKIYDAEGFPVHDLTNNFLLGAEGNIKWDGIDAEGNIVKMGMYIVFSRLFHTDGDIIESKHVVVAAQKF